MSKINSEWVRDQMLQLDGFHAGAKQMLQSILQILEQERKEKEKENGHPDGDKNAPQ